jgi:hypothetical protein
MGLLALDMRTTESSALLREGSLCAGARSAVRLSSDIGAPLAGGVP